MCMFIVLISPWVQQTAQFTPLVSELSLTRSHLLWGEFSAFLQLMPFHNSPFFRSTRYPSLLGGQRRSGMRGFAQHLYTQVTSMIWRNWLLYHVLPFVSDRLLASINRCCTVIQGQWLVPLDATRQRHHRYALSKAEARTAVPSHGSQVLRPLNHDCRHR